MYRTKPDLERYVKKKKCYTHSNMFKLACSCYIYEVMLVYRVFVYKVFLYWERYSLTLYNIRLTVCNKKCITMLL